MRGDITSIGASADHAARSLTVSALTAFAHISRAHVTQPQPRPVQSRFLQLVRKPPKYILYTQKRLRVSNAGRRKQVSGESNPVTNGMVYLLIYS